MKRLFLMTFVMLALFALMIGCGGSEDAGEATPDAAQTADMMDTTAMDSMHQMGDSMMHDSMMHDSM